MEHAKPAPDMVFKALKKMKGTADETLVVGDKVEVYVENQEDVKGQLVLSHKKARLMILS